MGIRTREATSDTQQPSGIIRWGFYAFLFSIPLEYPPRTIAFEVHTITGTLFLLLTLIQPRLCFRRVPTGFGWLVAYACLYVTMGLFTDHVAAVLKLFLNLLLVVFLFWVGYNLMRDEAIAKAAFVSFILGCAVISLLMTLDVATGTLDDRRLIFGQDPNTTGGNMALGIVVLLGMASSNWGRAGVALRTLAIGLAALFGHALILGGSRGAIVALGLGLLAFALKSGDLRSVFRSMAMAAVVAVGVTGAVYNSESMSSRAMVTIEKGNMAGRELIYPEAWQMFLEKPLLGWGPVDANYELGVRTHAYEIGKLTADGLVRQAPDKDTHNLALDVLTATGSLGALLLFTCLALCVRAAWTAREGARATGPLALIVVMLALSMDANWSVSKQGWILFAYAAASGSLVPGFRRWRATPALRRVPVTAGRIAGRRRVAMRQSG